MVAHYQLCLGIRGWEHQFPIRVGAPATRQRRPAPARLLRARIGSVVGLGLHSLVTDRFMGYVKSYKQLSRQHDENIRNRK